MCVSAAPARTVGSQGAVELGGGGAHAREDSEGRLRLRSMGGGGGGAEVLSREACLAGPQVASPRECVWGCPGVRGRGVRAPRPRFGRGGRGLRAPPRRRGRRRRRRGSPGAPRGSGGRGTRTPAPRRTLPRPGGGESADTSAKGQGAAGSWEAEWEGEREVGRVRTGVVGHRGDDDGGGAAPGGDPLGVRVDGDVQERAAAALLQRHGARVGAHGRHHRLGRAHVRGDLLRRRRRRHVFERLRRGRRRRRRRIRGVRQGGAAISGTRAPADETMAVLSRAGRGGDRRAAGGGQG